MQRTQAYVGHLAQQSRRETGETNRGQPLEKPLSIQRDRRMRWGSILKGMNRLYMNNVAILIMLELNCEDIPLANHILLT